MLLLFLTGVFALAAGSPHNAPNDVINYPTPAFEDLLAALSTKEEIWLTKSRHPVGLLKCIYWVNDGIYNKTNYNFFEWSRKGEQKRKYYMNAVLSNGTTAPEMKAKLAVAKGGWTTYTLQFWNSTENCFIFKTGDSCEKHVWKSKIDKTPECDKAYNDMCVGHDYPVYADGCINPKAICIGPKSSCIP